MRAQNALRKAKDGRSRAAQVQAYLDGRSRAAQVQAYPAEGQNTNGQSQPLSEYHQAGRPQVQLPPTCSQPGAQVPDQHQVPLGSVQEPQAYSNSHMSYKCMPPCDGAPSLYVRTANLISLSSIDLGPKLICCLTDNIALAPKYERLQMMSQDLY